MFKYSSSKTLAGRGALLAATLALLAGPATAMDVYLVAKPVDLTMPDSTVVRMWGFATDADSDLTTDGLETATVPGPEINVPAGDTTLNIHLRNDLGVPTSVGIIGQPRDMVPQTFVDGKGRDRIRSLDIETGPGGGIGIYSWTDLNPGTYLYRSVTHQQVQVQMGLYGAMTKDSAPGEAYPGVSYDVDQVLLYSEIDPALHDAVQTGTYGTAAMPSTIDYNPKYFLLNGEHRPYAATGPGVEGVAATADQNVLLRIVNAGLRPLVPMVLGTRCEVVAEDGNPYSYPRHQYTVETWAGTTRDCVIAQPAEGTYPIVERTLLGLGGPGGSGGMLAFLNVAAAGTPGPVATDDPYSTNEDTPLAVAAPGVLSNDDPALVSATLVSAPTAGTLTAWGGDGSFTYEPLANFNGQVTFTYRANDGVQDSNVATVTITVVPQNDAPVAVVDGFTVPSGTMTTVPARGVLENDKDVDGDTLMAVLDTDVSNGSLTLYSDGSFDYTPNAGFNGTDLFTYFANDGTVNSATAATVTITIEAPTPPVAGDDPGVTVTKRKPNDPLTGTDIDVLSNDHDSDGFIVPATVTVVDQPNRGGTATANGDGTVNYLPAVNFRGTEIFTYTVQDNDGLTSNVATVTINVVK